MSKLKVKWTVSDFRKQLLKTTGNARLIHAHRDINGSSEYINNYIMVDKATKDDVYSILNRYTVTGSIIDNRFMGEIEFELACDKTCPTLKIAWNIHRRNMKWIPIKEYIDMDKTDEVIDIDKSMADFVIIGLIEYVDNEFNIGYFIPCHMTYKENKEYMNFTMYFDGQPFKRPTLSSSNIRYARGRAMEIATESYMDHFTHNVSIEEIYNL